MVMFWVTLLAISIVMYVLLDGFDLGIGTLFGVAAPDEPRKHVMMSAVGRSGTATRPGSWSRP